ncbi:hypothetical protein BKA62DRAFT_87526 [Auriculariales sp. MPI-PUGE-AT-0066]|nr:hypothetical protein BKA62DRAFT_87526 [Auriculariales sp. MPI-PUGE-AT-0066]
MLRVNTALETLDIANCGVLDQGAAYIFDALKHNRSLKHLYLNASGLTVRTAKLIGDHLASGDSALEALHLNCNPFGDEGMQELARGLAKDTKLKRLALTSASMSATGLDALVDALVPSNARTAAHPALQHLNIGFMKGTYVFNGLSNYIRDAGARAIATRLLPNLPALRILDICHNGISLEGLAAIVAALEDGCTSLCSMLHQQFGQPTSVAIEARLKSLMHNNVVAWGKQQLNGAGDMMEWEKEGLKLLRAAETPEYIKDILSVYRTKD